MGHIEAWKAHAPIDCRGEGYGPHHTIAGIGATKEAIMHQIIQISCLGSAAALELETCQSHQEPFVQRAVYWTAPERN